MRLPRELGGPALSLRALSLCRWPGGTPGISSPVVLGLAVAVGTRHKWREEAITWENMHVHSSED